MTLRGRLLLAISLVFWLSAVLATKTKDERELELPRLPQLQIRDQSILQDGDDDDDEDDSRAEGSLLNEVPMRNEMRSRLRMGQRRSMGAARVMYPRRQGAEPVQPRTSARDGDKLTNEDAAKQDNLRSNVLDDDVSSRNQRASPSAPESLLPRHDGPSYHMPSAPTESSRVVQPTEAFRFTYPRATRSGSSYIEQSASAEPAPPPPHRLSSLSSSLSDSDSDLNAYVERLQQHLDSSPSSSHAPMPESPSFVQADSSSSHRKHANPNPFTEFVESMLQEKRTLRAQQTQQHAAFVETAEQAKRRRNLAYMESLARGQVQDDEGPDSTTTGAAAAAATSSSSSTGAASSVPLPPQPPIPVTSPDSLPPPPPPPSPILQGNSAILMTPDDSRAREWPSSVPRPPQYLLPVNL